MMLYLHKEPFILHWVEQTDSTNVYLKNLIKDNAHIKEFTVIATFSQTAGKGQRGNSWESEDKKNLTFSLLLQPNFLFANKQFLLSQIISLGIKKELDKYTDKISIKWPNDIYWQDKKISGILIENDLLGNYISQSIIGIGININQEQFSSMASNPVSLKQIIHQNSDLESIFSNILGHIFYYYTLLKKEQYNLINQDYHNSLFRKDGYYPFKDKNGEFIGQIDHVEPNGLLTLRDHNKKIRKYAFKEISFIL